MVLEDLRGRTVSKYGYKMGPGRVGSEGTGRDNIMRAFQAIRQGEFGFYV